MAKLIRRIVLAVFPDAGSPVRRVVSGIFPDTQYTGFLLQTNGDYLLQTNGDHLMYRLND